MNACPNLWAGKDRFSRKLEEKFASWNAMICSICSKYIWLMRHYKCPWSLTMYANMKGALEQVIRNQQNTGSKEAWSHCYGICKEIHRTFMYRRPWIIFKKIYLACPLPNSLAFVASLPMSIEVFLNGSREQCISHIGSFIWRCRLQCLDCNMCQM